MNKTMGYKSRLILKLLLGFTLIWVLPMTLMLYMSSKHLQTIQDVTAEVTRVVLISAQEKHLKDLLTEEASRLSSLFTRIQDETYMLGSYAQALLKTPTQHSFKNGSQYNLNIEGFYGNASNDSNSVLYVPQYAPDQDAIIAATESLDLMMKPLAERETRMVLAWMVHLNGVTRAYPWRDFNAMPRNRKVTAWPFFYLADPSHNPQKKVIFSSAYLDPLSREWMISCLYPVYLQGKFEATIGIDITIENILREISGSRLSKNSSSLLVSGNEIIAASSNIPIAALGLNPKATIHGQKLSDSTSPVIRELSTNIQNEKGDISRIKIEGLSAFVGHRTVEPLGWKIVYLVPENEVTVPANESAQKILSETMEMRVNFIHIIVFGLVGVIAIIFIVIVHQSKGLRMLLQGIRELGSGNLAHRIPEAPSEFGQLAKALNSMAGNLLEKKEELQRAIAVVEQGRKLTAIGRLAAGVAHEVNNPLATISTYAQMIIRRNDIPVDVSDNMKTVMEEIQRIQSQLLNLLDLSRIQSPVKCQVNLNQIVKDIADLVRYEATTRGVTLELDLCPDNRTINADRSGLKQVIWNLIRNAFDALDKDGTVRVCTFHTIDADGRLSYVIETQDDGPGIPDSHLPHIFEPFFTTKGVGQGTGLGLSIVYNIVKDHNGTIEARNLSPTGCLFKIVIPVTEGE